MLKLLIAEHKGDGYDARFLLGKIAADEGLLDDARRELALAKKYDPDSAEPYLVLGKALLKTNEDEALKELEKAAELEVMDASIPKLLVERYAAKERWADVVRTAKLSQLIDPHDAGVHAAMARAYLALGNKRDAAVEIDLGLASANDAERATLKALGAKAGAPPPTSPR